MADEYILKHLQDVLDAINEKNIERIIAEYEEQYNRENNTESDCK
ncbi:hypothetical protein [Muribaculum caecicola]|nr:hypothetical protein [Muribaculum caecicola]